MMMGATATANGQLSVPPGFRFHPTDEELLYYYLRKKVSYEAIDLDVIREVDLNKLEPWDLKDKCRIGSGPQNEWYFFSHKDKKYPTGTRTNRATTAGFWKATGRDKAIHLSSNSKRIGMRKTLVFYTGRAPHGQKTDWIMHEYRLDDDHHNAAEVQEDGWVVCRVFKKKNLVNKGGAGGFQSELMDHGTEHDDHFSHHHIKSSSTSHQNHTNMVQAQLLYDNNNNNNNYPVFDSNCSSTNGGGIHLPQLFSPETALLLPQSDFISPISLNSMDMECSQSLLRLTSMQQQQQQAGSDWSFLDKLLASHPPPSNLDHNQSSQMMGKSNLAGAGAGADHHHHVGGSAHKFPFQYLGFETDILKFSK